MSDTPEGSGRGSSSSGSDRQRESDRLRSVASSANTASHFNDRHTEYHWELDESTRRASVAATKLYDPGVGPQQWPIVYHRNYDVSFGGIEKLHPFDAGKWGKIYQFLKDAKMVTDTTTVRPMEASGRDLRVVHTEKYLKSLKCSCIVAGIIEVPPVACLPNCLVDRY
uniref:Histone deacetylase n=1 Tax=Plectus sambesii TaxID=2011161 RepID=A0A914UP14_9BILA